MTLPDNGVRRIGPLLVAAALQTGCASQWLDSNVPAPASYRLGTPSSVAEAGVTPRAVGLALTVARPRASTALDTDRIAVIPALSRFDYYSDVRWAEAAPQMLQQSLVAALESSRRFAGVFAAPARVPAELMLDVELRHFEAVATAGNAAPSAHVQLQVSLVDSRRATRVTSFVSDARVPARQNRRAEIVAAFEEANARVVADVVTRISAAAASLDSPPGAGQ
ncbi:MAG TPA: ABC-type transport auxiliary lipoprotein family protein [Steroidobacteraceae bacterium]|nr:ABC-type transport auxiliary lipoprotein family protein [Steroidobacteraceae bacterium]